MERLSAFELDDLGIIPRRNESEEEFIERGSHMLFVSKYSQDEKFAVALKLEKISLVSPRFQRRIKRELSYLKVRYGVDLEWVKIFRLAQPWYKSVFDTGGVCNDIGFVCDGFGSVSVKVKVPIVRLGLASAAWHELIHAARNFSIGDYKKSKKFEEMIACDRYNNIFSLEILALALFEGGDTQVFNIRKARRILMRYFGERHGYVFIRLTCEEILKFVVSKDNPYGNPLIYLQVMGESHLKHRIMCEKLGL